MLNTAHNNEARYKGRETHLMFFFFWLGGFKMKLSMATHVLYNPQHSLNSYGICSTHPKMHLLGNNFCSFHCPCTQDFSNKLCTQVSLWGTQVFRISPWSPFIFPFFCFFLGLQKVPIMRAHGRTDRSPFT